MRRWWLMLVLAAFTAVLLPALRLEQATGQAGKKDPAKKKGGKKGKGTPETPPVADPNGVPAKPVLAVEHGRHVAAIADFAFTADGRKLVTIGADNTIQLWDAVTRAHLKTLRLPWQEGRAKIKGQRGELVGLVHAAAMLAIAPDGKTLAVAPDKHHHQLFLVHLETGRIRHLTGAAFTGKGVAPLAALAFSPDGDLLAALRRGNEKLKGPSNSIKVWHGLQAVWQPEAPAPVLLREWNRQHFLDVQFAPDGSKLAVCGRHPTGTGGNTGRYFVWVLDLKQPDAPPRAIVPRETKAIHRVAWGPQGSRLAAEFDDPRRVAVWTADGLLLGSVDCDASVKPDRELRLRPLFRGDNELLLIGGAAADQKSAAVLRFDLKKKGLDEFLRYTRPEPLHAVRIAPGGQRLATLGGVGRGTIAVLDLEPNGKLQLLGGTVAAAAPQIAFSKKGYKFAWTGTDPAKLIAGIDLRTAEPLPPAELQADAFAPPARTAASGRYEAVPRPGGGGLIDIRGEVKGKKPQLVFTVYTAGPDWMVCTPEGYYAASPGGEKLVGWHVDNGPTQLASFYACARFRKQLYRPDVIALVLDKGSVALALKVANVLRGQDGADTEVDAQLPPRAVLSVLDQTQLPTVKLKVRAEAAAKRQPVTALRLLLDGRPLPGGAAHEQFEGGKSAAEAAWTVKLPPGKHQLVVLARCADSSSVSNAIEVEVADPTKQNFLHVLAIGVSAYQDPTLKLDFAAKDAQAIAANFRKCCKGDLFKEVYGEVLIDAAARKQTILERLAALRRKAKPNDLVVVSFAGHGVKDKDRFYLLNVEARTDQLAKTALSGAELRAALGEFPCQVLLLLDACHASAGLKSFRPAVDDLTRNLTDDDCGVAVLCAAMAHERAQEKDGNGLFTRAVVDGLNHGDGVPFNAASRLFYVHHLHAYVFDRVSLDSGGKQHPFLSLPWVVESFPLAKFANRAP